MGNEFWIHTIISMKFRLRFHAKDKISTILPMVQKMERNFEKFYDNFHPKIEDAGRTCKQSHWRKIVRERSKIWQKCLLESKDGAMIQI